MKIALVDIHKKFGDFTALRDINLTIRDGELVALLGPSGSGKTTLLRLIAGLEQPDPRPTSRIEFDGEDVTELHARHRRVGFVFQHYALFRHMTVFDNIAFGLRVRPRKERPSKRQIHEKVTELLELVQLRGMADRYPSQLSGGQRQRVALARALAVEPRVLLLDEPFGALDAKVRQDLRRWLRRLHDELHITSVFVTHDQDEALEVADRVVVMNQAAIEQVGTPEEVFYNPASEFVMRFIGNVNIFHGRIRSGKALFGDLTFEHAAAAGEHIVGDAGESAVARAREGAGLGEGQVDRAGQVEGAGPGEGEGDGEGARLLVRPENVELYREQPHLPAFRATIRRIRIAGPHVKIDLESPAGEVVHAVVPHDRYRQLRFAEKERVYVALRDARLYVGGHAS